MRERPQLLELFGHPWAMREPEYRRVVARSMALEIAPESLAFLFGFEEEEEEPPYERRGDVAIVRVRGSLFRQATYFSRFFGDRTYSGIADCFKQAMEHDSVRSIVFDVDSPGGDALGLSELSDLIYAARSEKPSTAVIRGLGASAAYFIASSASRVVCAKEAMVGSIGTVATYLDWKQFDAKIGIKEIEIVSSQSPKKRPDPSTDAGRAQIQQQVDDIAENFVVSVARNRGVSREIVLRDYGQGDVLVGQRAVDAGLADEIATLDEVVERAAESRRSNSRPALRAAAMEGSMTKSIEIEKITAEWLAENRPEVASALRAAGEQEGIAKGTAAAATAHATALETARTAAKAEGLLQGATAERERILAIEEVADPAFQALADAAKKDPNATAATLAVSMAKERKKTAGAKLELLRKDEEKVTDVSVSTPAAEDRAKGRALGKQIAELK